MPVYLFANEAQTTLALPIQATDTQILVAYNTGSIFPIPSVNQIVQVTIASATNPLLTEIVWCTAISGDTLTVIRGQEGTTARAWNAGDYVANLITAGTNENFIQVYQLENPTYNAQFLNVSATTGQIINAPVNPTDITNKNYVDTLVASGIIPNPLTFGTGLVSGSYNGKTAVTINVDETVIATLSTAQTLTNKSISGALNTLSAIPNSALDYSSITINGVSIALGGSNNITANTSNLLYSGTGLAGGPFNGSSPVTISIAPSGVIAGTYGSVNTVPSITVNTEGQVTNIALDPIAISNSQVSGLGTLSTQNANNVNITGGSISGTSIGLGNPSSIDATTVNATLFSGSGAGLTGTASGLSIGGSSATSNASSNILGGGAYQIPYQISSGNTSFINAPSVADTYLFWNGTSYSWQTVTTGSVTSVSASGGLTGLTFTGSPITTAGTLTLGGILNVESGGTGTNSLTGYVYGNGTGALTASTSIPNTAISGLGTMSTQYANNVNITGGNISGVVVSLESINNTPIGNLIPSTGAFTTLSSTGLANLNTLSTISATISSGEIDNSIIGQLIPNKAYFTTLSANGTLTLSSYTGYLYGNGSGFVTASTTIPTSALSGTVNSNQLTPTGVTAGTYGSSAVIPVLTVNAEGQITSISVQASNAPAYQGTWNASTNTPTLTSGVGTQGYYYVVSVAGNTTLDGVSGWNVGDWAIFENGHWEKIPGSTSESFTNLTTTNLAVTGLTGYMYANGSGNVTASMTVPTSVLSGTVNSNQLTPTGVTAGSYTYGSFTVNAEGQLTLASSNPTTGSGNIVLSNSPTITGAWGSPDSIQFNVGASVTPTVGKIYWDGGSTLNLGMTTQTVQSIGEDQFIYVKATSAITAGQSIMFTGAVGASGVLTAAPATGVTKASYIMGVACENIPVNGFGLIQTFGLIQNLNTSAYAPGTVLYYDPSTVGGLTSVEPVAPNIKVQLAAVVNQGTGNGSIFVRRQESGTINNITEIQVTNPLNYNLLQYNGTIWQNVASLNGVPIGNIYPTIGVFTSLTASTSTLGTATASSLNSTPIGNTTPSTGAFTTLSTTGLATLNSLSTSNATITGGSISNVALTLDSINNTPIGNVTPSSGAFTTLSTTGLATLNSLSTANAQITGGSITGVSLTLDSLNSTPIGNTTPSTGAFTTLSTTGLASLNSLSTANATITGGSISGVSLTLDSLNSTPIGSTTPSTGAFTTLTASTSVLSPIVGAGTGSNLSLQANATTYATLTTAGYLGIGTTNPVAIATLNAGGGWSGNNFGKQLYITTPTNASNPCVGLSDATGANNIAIANLSGAFSFASMPAITDGTTGAIERMRIDSSGNLGLGVTPNASTAKLLQIEGGGVISSQGNGIDIASNGAYNNGWVYSTSNFASHYSQSYGTHAWYIAPSGTAGSPITFTQAMTLTNNNQLLIGASSGVTGDSNTVQIFSSSYGPLQMRNTLSTAGYYWRTGPDNSSAYIIYDETGVGVFLQHGGTAWNPNSSDQRLKNKVSDINNALEAVNKLNPLTFYFKNEPNEGVPRYGYFAQNVGDAIPDAKLVSPKKDEELGEIYTYNKEVIDTYVVAAIKELTQLVSQLKAEIAELKGAK